MLINDILDLSKIESGTVAVDVGELRLDDLQRYVERTFRHVAEAKKRRLRDRSSTRRCRKSMFTDAKRLQQIIKNLLSNAFKFTQHGQVTLDDRAGRERLERRQRGAEPRRRRCSRSRSPTPASASRRTSSRSSSRRSSRPTAAPAASTAAPAWAWRSAASCRACWAARSGWSARRARAARSRSTCRRATSRAQRAQPREPAMPPPIGARRDRRPRERAVDAARARGCARTRHDGSADRADGASRSLAERGRRRPRRASQPGDRVLLIVENDLALRPRPARRGAREGLQGPGHVAGAGGAGDGARVQARRRSRSTSSCPTSRAGASSSGSRTTSRRGTSRSASSRPTRRASARCSSGARRLRRQADPDARTWSTRLLDELNGYMRRGRRRKLAGGRCRRRRAARELLADARRPTIAAIVASTTATRRRERCAAATSTAWSSTPALPDARPGGR